MLCIYFTNAYAHGHFCFKFMYKAFLRIKSCSIRQYIYIWKVVSVMYGMYVSVARAMPQLLQQSSLENHVN